MNPCLLVASPALILAAAFFPVLIWQQVEANRETRLAPSDQRTWFPRLDAALTWLNANPDVLFVLLVSPMVGGVIGIMWSALS